MVVVAHLYIGAMKREAIKGYGILVAIMVTLQNVIIGSVFFYLH